MSRHLNTKQPEDTNSFIAVVIDDDRDRLECFGPMRATASWDNRDRRQKKMGRVALRNLLPQIKDKPDILMHHLSTTEPHRVTVLMAR